jgi:CDP-glycerol glycerophosphotransferase
MTAAAEVTTSVDGAADERQAQRPDVTVVIGVYNAMPYLIECLNSVLAQTIARDRVEIVAVDDGSTDGSGELLDQYARLDPRLRVVHQANSGTPAGPRNLGIELARGRYIFFLDNDDYLGPEALERLVDVARSNGSDVVVGRIVGIGRRVPVAMFSHNQPKADLYESKVYTSLRAQRLFSRAVIDRAGLRFPELMVAQDQPFAALAYIYADVISVVADYDCYYLRLRDDGQNIVTRVRQIGNRIGDAEHTMTVVADHVDAGPKRDFLMRKHFADLAEWCFREEYLEATAQEREDVIRRAQALLTRYYSPAVADSLAPSDRLRFALVELGLARELADVVAADTSGRHPEELVESGRVFVRYPGFREARLGLPDALFDLTGHARSHHLLAGLHWTESALRITGHAFLEHVDMSTVGNGGQVTRLVLRERRGNREVSLPVTPTASPVLTKTFGGRHHDYGMAGFTIDVDVAGLLVSGRLSVGLWDVFVDIRAQGVSRVVRFGRQRAPAADVSAVTRPVLGATSPLAVTPYFTKPHGNLTLDVGTDVERSRPRLTVGQVAWARGVSATLVVTGEADPAALAGLPGARVSVVLKDADGGATHEAVASVDARTGRFVAVMRFAGVTGRTLAGGRYAVAVMVHSSVGRWQWPVPPPAARLAAARWLRRGVPAYATDTSSRRGVNDDGAVLTLSISGLGLRRLARGLARRLRRLARHR